MSRIDVHCHFLPNLDDGCQSLAESLTCLRMMARAGYGRVFCTPHSGASGFMELELAEVAGRVRRLQEEVAAAVIPIELKPGGEVRLTPDLARDLPGGMVPTYGHAGKYVLVDLWEQDWPGWAVEGVTWLQGLRHTVILAHPERMPALREKPERIEELAGLGLLFQGNLGPMGGADAADIVALSHRYLKEGRYFMLGTDGHRERHMDLRLWGLKVAEALVGPAKVEELTVTNPGMLWKGDA
jgi:protein-tyrosine phosphatase